MKSNLLLKAMVRFIGMIVLNLFILPHTLAQTSTIDLNIQHQYIRGFGGMNFPRWIGDLTADQRDKAFGTGDGQIGLSILRIDVPPSNGYWSQHIATASRAKSLGAIVIASPWSPPASMKTNNNIVDGELRTDAYDDYANHLTDFCNYMSSNGVSLHAISIQNEPDIIVGYESCRWSSTQMRNFLTNNASVIPTRVIVSESFNFDRTETDPILNDPAAEAQVDIIGGHIYGGGLYDYPLARSKGKEVWMTEHLVNDTIWVGALATGKEIHDCMVANFNAYIWWYVRRSYGPINESSNVTKRGYVMSQFAKFVRPSCHRIAATANPTTNVDITAYKNDTSLVIIALNRNSSSRNITFKLQNGTVSSFSRYTTSSSKNLSYDGSTDVTNDSCTVTLDASSITTFIGILPGWYRSHQSGDWNNNSVWEMHNGTDWENPVTLIPDSASGFITIRSGHHVQVTDNKIVDQLFVQPAGTLQIATGDTVVINDGLGIDLTLDGVLLNYGTVNKDDSAVVWVRDGGKYIHAQDGNDILIAAWTNGSTCEITGVVSNLPLNADQNFYHFTWNCSGQTSDVSMGWNDYTIGGNINIQNTGTGVLQLCSPAADTPVVININGDFNQTSGIFATHMSNEGGTSVTINQGGNINITGGQFSISGGTQGGTGTTAWNLTNGNFSISDADIENSTTTPLGAEFVFKKAGTQNLNIGSGNTIVALPIEVNSGTTLNIGTSELTGNGHFILNSGATLEMAHSYGIDSNIQTSGTKILSKSANYTYNGSVAQVTGYTLPDTVNNLTLNNSAGLTLSSDVAINGTMEMREGLMQSGGGVMSYGADGALQYSGSDSIQTTGDVEFPTVDVPKVLLISNTSGVILHASRQIRGNLNLEGNLVLGANTLTAGSATMPSATTAFVNTDGGGRLRMPVANSTEVLYPVGASGGSTVSFCPVWITNNGDSDTVTLGAVMDTMNATKPRVNLKWSIEGSGGSGNYAMKFGWNTTAGVHENSLFGSSRTDNARIFLMGSDTVEAGSGDYEFNFDFPRRLYTAKRGGIIELGMFAVGKFKDSVWTGIAEEIPRSYRLIQNYPNPFNQVTVIRYELPRSEEVELVIYNLLGQEVAVLARGKKEAGYYKVEWKASNLPTGVYFYRLTAGSFTDTKKLLFVK